MKKKFKSLYKKDVILDTNVIIDLQELDKLHLPMKIFNKVYIYDNILTEELNNEEGNELKNIGYIPINLRTHSGLLKLHYLNKNHKCLSIPDKVVISIACENNIIYCTNDKTARNACKDTDINTIGTLDILCCAFENECLDKTGFYAVFNTYCKECSSYTDPNLINDLRSLYTIPKNNIVQLQKSLS